MDDHTKQTLIDLLQNNEQIPAEYQDILFPVTKKEYELVYAGKERPEVILNNTMSAPFQEIKHFGDVKDDEWTNMLIFGDNLQALKHLLKLKEEGKLKNADGTDGPKLVYIDPPFATKQDFQGNKDQKAYTDKVAGAEFIEFLRKRLVFLHKLLADDGTIWVHLDDRMSSQIRLILDEIFNANHFQNEIIWYYPDNFQGNVNRYANNHNNILVYSKSDIAKLNRVKVKLDKPVKRDVRIWDKNEGKVVAKRDENGNIVYETFTHKTADDVWQIGQSSVSKKKSSEYLGYPTQKPEELIKRVIKSASNEEDIILDCFAGSGTTGTVAEKLNRKWIMCDCGKLAIYTIEKRMVDLKKEIGNKGQPLRHKPFVLYNAGLYYNDKLVKEMQGNDYKDFVLELFECQKREHKINGLQMHGTLNNHSVMVFDREDYLTYEFIDQLHEVVGASIKNALYIVAPAGIIGFAEDYVTKNKVKYTVLKIPNSIIEHIKEKNFSRLKQPRSADDINQTIDSVGFDFIYPPEVKSGYYVENPKGKLIESQYVIEIEDFEPIQLGSKIVEFDDAKSESLAMIMLDTDYNGEVFKLDKYFFGVEITKNDFKITLEEELGDQIMIIYLDIFGNEKREVVSKSDFVRR